MGEKQKIIADESESVEAPRSVAKKEAKKAKLPWYFASGFLAFYGLLFFAVVIPFFYSLPTPLTMEDAKRSVFITERAYSNLNTLANLGNKLTGTKANEVDAVNFILNELESIREVMLTDIYEMEVDLSNVSDAFPYQSMLSMFQKVQNIAVRITPKNSVSDNYLLVNSHFDSKPFTNSAGDANFMVVIMLEVMRVIVTTRPPLQHTIIFLFNGAEENGLQASYGFTQQNKFASKCRILVNLDAAGSGGKVVLFQSGPNHAWLMNYYAKYIPYPFATVLAEEIFQSGIIPSDTDYRNFVKYLKMAGLDMAQCIQGQRYHTKYDLIDAIPRGSMQNTGDNVLGLVRGLANSTELNDPEKYKNGTSVFFDFLGIYFVHYTQANGIVLNYGVSAAAIILVLVSVMRIASASKISVCSVIPWFVLVFIAQLISVVLGLVFPIAVSIIFDRLGLSLTYYSVPLFVIGLYVTPSMIGLALPITLYYNLQGNSKISAPNHLQLALHSQALILTVLTAGSSVLGLRSGYIFMIPLVFYVVALAVNLLTTLHDRGYSWTGLVKLSQIIPFLYSSYVIYLFVVVLTPMGARAGPGSNRDLYIAGLSALGTILCFGFLIPLINTFRRPSIVIFGLIAVTAVTMYLASSTQLGFPYRPVTNGMRVQYLNVRNKAYEYDGTLKWDRSGFLYNFQDRRKEQPLRAAKVNLAGLIPVKNLTGSSIDVPMFDYRFTKNFDYLMWQPRSEVIVPNDPETTLTMLSKTSLNETCTRFEFNATGPNYRSVFVQPIDDARVINWSFKQSYLKEAPAGLPYHVYITSGLEKDPLIFYIDVCKSDGDFNVPVCNVAFSGHYITYEGDAVAKAHLASMPKFAIVAEWPVLHLNYVV